MLGVSSLITSHAQEEVIFSIILLEYLERFTNDPACGLITLDHLLHEIGVIGFEYFEIHLIYPNPSPLSHNHAG